MIYCFGMLELIEAIYWQSILDIATGKKHGKFETWEYCTAEKFLFSSVRGQRILGILNECNEQQIKRIINIRGGDSNIARVLDKRRWQNGV